jgi:hypothetical protein
MISTFKAGTSVAERECQGGNMNKTLNKLTAADLKAQDQKLRKLEEKTPSNDDLNAPVRYRAA